MDRKGKGRLEDPIEPFSNLVIDDDLNRNGLAEKAKCDCQSPACRVLGSNRRQAGAGEGREGEERLYF